MDYSKVVTSFLRAKGYHDAADDLEVALTAAVSLKERLVQSGWTDLSGVIWKPKAPAAEYGPTEAGIVGDFDIDAAMGRYNTGRHYFDTYGGNAPLAATSWGSTPQDSVVLPNHYGRWNIEAIRFIVENNGPGFLYENATKYLWRYDAKNGHEDLAKAARYIEMLRMYEAGYPEWWKPYAGQMLPTSKDAALKSAKAASDV